jgi:hypothetical protein
MDLIIMYISISNEHHKDNNHFPKPSSLPQQLHTSQLQTQWLALLSSKLSD